MKAVEITTAGGPDVMQLTDRPTPTAKHGEVVIKVAYAGVNRPDALQRAGLYSPPATASDLPGLEASGEIVEIGAGVRDCPFATANIIGLWVQVPIGQKLPVSA